MSEDYYRACLYGMLRNLLTEEEFDRLMESSMFPLPESLHVIGKYRMAELTARPNYEI
jgi:hypothetical protein